MDGQFNIDRLFAVIVRDDDGTEGVAAMITPGGQMPMVGADLARLESLLIPVAQMIADASGKTLSVCVFSHREEYKLIEPNRLSTSATVDLGDGLMGIVGGK